MILEALRLSVVRLFRKSDTSVPSQIDRSNLPLGMTIDEFVAFVTKNAPRSALRELVDQIRPSGPEPAPSRPGVKPPADPEIDNASWEWWETCRGTQRVPGWAYCRFANRVGDKAQFAFGYVRGSFGIWAKPFRTCTGFHPDVISSQQVLVTGTHLLTGHSIGLFDTMTIAAEACELADRVAGEWATEKDAKGLDAAILRTQQAWHGAGIAPSTISHAHDDDEPVLILCRSIESVMEGKPKRLS